MASSDIRAGRAFVELGTINKELERGLADAQKRLNEFGKGAVEAGKKIAELGTAGLAGFAGAVAVYVRVGSSLEEMSQRTGVAVEALSQLEYAAGQAGVSGESLEAGLRKMQRSLAGAAAGAQQPVGALRALGLTMADLKGAAPDRQFEMIADRLAGVADPARKAALTMQLFGRGGADLLPLMNQGAAGIDALRRRADQLGLTISGPAAAGSRQLARTLDDLWAVGTRTAYAVGAALAPALERLSVPLLAAAGGANRFVQAHQGLVVAAAAATLGVTVLGGAAVAAGYGLIGLGAAAGGLATVVGGLATAAGVIGSLGAAVGAVLASPIILAGAAVVGLGGHFLATSGVAGRAFAAIKAAAGGSAGGILSAFGHVWASLKSAWATVAADAAAAFGGIRDALAAGDWGTAAAILWTSVKLEFAKGVAGIWNPLADAFGPVRAAVLDGWVGTVAALQTAWSYAKEYLSNWDGIKAAAGKVGNWLLNAWTNVIDAISDKFAAFMVRRQAEADVQAKYGGKKVDAGGADMLAAQEIADRRDQVMAAHPGMTAGDAVKQVDAGKIRAEYQQRFNTANGGRQMNEAELEEQKDKEVARRVASVSQRRRASDLAQASEYAAKQKAIDDAYAKSHPDEVSKGSAERKRIGDDATAARAKNDAGPDHSARDAAEAKRVADLQKQLDQLRQKAGDERRATPAAKEAKEAAGAAGGGGELGDGVKDQPKKDTTTMVGGDAGYGLGAGGGMQSRIASATEQTAKNTAALAGRSPVGPLAAAPAPPPAAAPLAPGAAGDRDDADDADQSGTATALAPPRPDVPITTAAGAAQAVPRLTGATDSSRYNPDEITAWARYSNAAKRDPAAPRPALMPVAPGDGIRQAAVDYNRNRPAAGGAKDILGFAPGKTDTSAMLGAFLSAVASIGPAGQARAADHARADPRVAAKPAGSPDVVSAIRDQTKALAKAIGRTTGPQFS